MSNKEDNVYEVEDLRALCIAWVKDNSSDPSNYLTPEGQAFLNGFLLSQNTIHLIKKERYEELLNNYEELLTKYEDSRKTIFAQRDMIRGMKLKVKGNKFTQFINKYL